MKTSHQSELPAPSGKAAGGDGFPERVFDDLAGLAAQICDTSFSWIFLQDDMRPRIEARVGCAGLEELMEIALCSRILEEFSSSLVVADISTDGRFCDVGPLSHPIRSFAARVLVSNDGTKLGVLAVGDCGRRDLTLAHTGALEMLARQIVSQVELRQKCALLRAIAVGTADAIFVKDLEGRYLFFNEAAASYVGVPSSEVVGRDDSALFSPEHAALVKANDREVMVTGETRTNEEELTAAGVTRTYLATKGPYRDSKGSVIGLIGVSRDVTERVEAEKALRASVEENANLCKALNEHAIVARTDAHGRITFANDKFCQISKYTREELIGKDHRIIKSGHHSRQFMRELWSTVCSGRIWQGEIQNRAKDGTYYWVQSTIMPFLDETGKPREFIAIRSDITERKHAVDGLRLFRTLVDHSNDTFEVIDADTGRFLDVNDKATSDHGYTREEYLSLHIWDVAEPMDWPAVVLRLRQQGSSRGESMHRRKDGTLFPVEFSAKWVELDRCYVVATIRDITQRKLAEAENSRRREELELILGSVPALVYYKDRESRFLRVNRALAQLVGCEEEDFLGKTDAEMGSRVSEQYRRDDLHVMTTGRTLLGREELIDVAGERRWLLTHKVPYRAGSGEIIGLVGFSVDITARKRAEERLLVKQSHSHSLLRFSGALERVHSHAEIVAAIKDEVRRVLGMSTAWLYLLSEDRQFLTIVNGEAKSSAGGSEGVGGHLRVAGDPMLEAIVSSGSLVMVEDARTDSRTNKEIVEKLGNRTIVNVPVTLAEQRLGAIGTGTFGEEGIRQFSEAECEYLTALASHAAAVIDRLTVSSARSAAEQRIRRLVESNVQGVFFWRLDGRITEANDAFLKLVGKTRDDLREGRVNWKELTPGEFEPEDQKAAMQLAANRVCDPYEKEFVTADGRRIPVLLGAAYFEDGSDEGVCFAVDLTERKRLEQQFLRSQRMESIGTLAGGIAHDLNNVLSPIMMSLAVLETRMPDAESRELLAILRNSATRGAEMVKQVLSFARGIEGRRIELQMAHVIAEVEKIANDTFLKTIHVRTSVPSDLWCVQGDPTQLHQVLLNLCVNARDAMAGGGTLTISAQNVHIDSQFAGLNVDAKPGPYLCVAVVDTGSGIPAKILDKIFDPFFTTKEVGKGTGLGLSTSQAIVKSHGGFFSVQSEVGRGTQFKLYLPALGGGAGGASEDSGEQNLPRGNQELILVVDDELSVRQITKHTLESYGYQVALAADGTEAVRIYAGRKGEITAVLTDMMMPVMDGLTTIRVIQRLNPQVAIIAASGLAASGDIALLESLGVRHFLPKPYTAQMLLAALKKLISELEAA